MSNEHHYLFFDKRLDAHLARELKMLANKISEISNLPDVGKKGDDLERQFKVRPCVLLREGAKLTPVESASGTTVTVRINLQGDTSLLTMAANGQSQVSVGTVKIEGGTSWYLGNNSDPDDRYAPHLSFSKIFGSADREEVRAWAKDAADRIEEGLAAQTPQIEEYNAALPTTIAALLAERKRIIDQTDNLRGGLGEGI